ncbi:MAG: hypothetical protein Ta2B_00550 [Termitinemataceae bacterium]|nr:MAG: hypothetical protein Ta2B_00550 [Termitinemataceae bacterium]
MSNTGTKRLEINNFLSISYVKWDVNSFNVITGDMGSGKSLCIKLLQYFEDIIPELFVLPYSEFFFNLDIEEFYKRLKDDFSPKKFHISAMKDKKYKEFTVTYTYMFKTQSISIKISSDEQGNISVESVFLEKLLKEWKDKIENNESVKTPDGFQEVKKELFNNLLKMFENHYPVATIFVPASRASLAFTTDIHEDYLKEYYNLINALESYRVMIEENFHDILKADVQSDEKTLQLVSNDGRIVPLSKASSGQQEIVYVLQLLSKLGKFSFTYGKHINLYIEEPSAHLFPLEQKLILELMVGVFNKLNETVENEISITVTTHSPYVLNIINNMLKKGHLKKEVNRCKDASFQKKILKKIERLQFPPLDAENVSAFFIESSGNSTNMMQDSESGAYLYDSKIEEITSSIEHDYISVKELLDEVSEKDV